MARDNTLMIRVDDSVKERFQAQANSFGLTMSALGAFVIGEWLSNRERVAPFMENLASGLIEMVKNASESQIGGANEQDLVDLQVTLDKFVPKSKLK